MPFGRMAAVFFIRTVVFWSREVFASLDFLKDYKDLTVA